MHHQNFFSIHMKKYTKMLFGGIQIIQVYARFRSVLKQVTPERALRDSIYPIGSLMIGNEGRDHGAERKVWNI